LEVKELEEIVDNIILQHDYPGFEPRSLNVALPQLVNDAPARLYFAALSSENIYVQLVSLRWFQTRLGAARRSANAIANQLDNKDAWVRFETIRTIEIGKLWDENSILKICALLKDPDERVREQAAKACGYLARDASKLTKPAIQKTIITSLKEASQDSAESVRRKAVKSLRKLGAFSLS